MSKQAGISPLPPGVEASKVWPVDVTVLQHGQTPAGWVNATLVLENSATGETIRVEARPQGADGHFVANVRFPEAGYWIWRVDITDLILEDDAFDACGDRDPRGDPVPGCRSVSLASEQAVWR